MNSFLPAETLDLLKLYGGLGASALILLFLAKWFYETLWLKKKALLQTNLSYEEFSFVEDKNSFLKRKLSKRSIKIRRYKHRLEILKFNPNLNAQNISSEVATVERIFHRKIIQVDFKNYGLFKHKEKVIFTFEHFKDLITAKDFKESLKVGDYWLGQNAKGENLVQSRKEPFLFIAGGKGSGKSVALSSQIISYLSSFTNNGRPQPKLVLVSSEKMSEFVPLIKRLSKTGKVLVFNANNLEEITALNKLLDDHLKKCGEFFQTIKNESLIVRHWFDIEHQKKAEPVHFVFDEAPEYLGELLKVKVSKDSSPEEIEAHALNEQKKRLGFLIDRIFKTLRESGTTVVVSSQTALASDLQAISFSNLKNCFILGRGITAQVLNLWGLTELSQQHLKEGCFYFYNGKEYGILKAPFLTAEGEE